MCLRFFLYLMYTFYLVTYALTTAKSLHCMICSKKEGDTASTLEQFRVRQDLEGSKCPMEIIKCEPYQDTCVYTITEVTYRNFWIGSGCDQRINYDVPVTEKDGCIDIKTYYRNYQPEFIEDQRVTQRICLCNENLCNGVYLYSFSTNFQLKTVVLCLFIWLIFHLIGWR